MKTAPVHLKGQYLWFSFSSNVNIISGKNTKLVPRSWFRCANVLVCENLHENFLFMEVQSFLIGWFFRFIP